MRLHKCGWVSIQSGERLNGIQEVSGSIPLISTKKFRKALFLLALRNFSYVFIS